MARATAPGPRGIALVRAVRGMLADPLPVLDELHARHGDVVSLRAPGLRVLLLSHPADVEQLLVGHARATDKGSSMERVRIGMGRNLFTLEGDAHAERRRLLTPIFRARDVAAYAPHAIERAETETRGWRDGEVVRIDEAMDLLALDAMAHVMLGAPQGDEAARLAPLVHDSVAITPLLLDPLYPLKARAWPPHARPVADVVSRWDALCDELVARARDQRAGEGAPPNVLHELVAGHEGGAALLEDDDALREELRGLLLSAHETTALALSWTLHELAHAPDELAAVQAQVDEVLEGGRAATVADLPALRLVRAAFEEALRLRGGTFVVRGALEDLRLDHAGVTVPAGTDVLASMWVTHRDARWWDDPLRFRPARFDEPAPERPRFAWYPFGGGRRTCIGMHLALQSGVLVLATLLRDWTLGPRDGDAPVGPVSNVLVRPQRPIELRPTARRSPG